MFSVSLCGLTHLPGGETSSGSEIMEGGMGGREGGREGGGREGRKGKGGRGEGGKERKGKGRERELCHMTKISRPEIFMKLHFHFYSISNL